MDKPTKLTDQDPNGVAAGIVAFVGTLLVAVDQTGALSSRWLPVVQTVVALAALLWARRKAYAPATVERIKAELAKPDQHPAQLLPIEEDE